MERKNWREVAGGKVTEWIEQYNREGPYGDRTKWQQVTRRANLSSLVPNLTPGQIAADSLLLLTYFTQLFVGVNPIFALTFAIVSKSQTLK
jgi:hypothetical protein